MKSVSRRVIVSPEHGSVIPSDNCSLTKKLESYLISSLQRKLLDKCDDDCPNIHYQKVVHFHDESSWNSKLAILE